MCSPCPYSVFPGTPGFLTTDSFPTCLPNSPLYLKSLSHLSLSVPVLTVSDPCPDHNSLNLSLLFSQSSERSSALEGSSSKPTSTKSLLNDPRQVGCSLGFSSLQQG